MNWNANDVVAAYAPNEGLPLGARMVMIRLSVSHNGADRTKFTEKTELAIFTSGGDRFSRRCGAIPESLIDEPQMSAGDTAEGNICLVIPDDAIDGATLSVGDLTMRDDTRWFFALE